MGCCSGGSVDDWLGGELVKRDGRILCCWFGLFENGLFVMLLLVRWIGGSLIEF